MNDEASYRKNTPVFINNFNQPTYLKRLVDTFLDNGFCNLIIIDQASKGEATIGLLARLETDSRCKIMRMTKNRGPRYFFDSLRYLFAGRYFLYTDPDIELPVELPADFVTNLISLSNRYKIGKVGCALDISQPSMMDNTVVVQEHETLPLSIIEFEARYWHDPVEPDVYAAAVDTTLALYNQRYFRLWNFFKSLRVAGSFIIMHRPWYKNKMIPQAEQQFYNEQCKYSSWLNTDSSGKSLFRQTPAIALIAKLKYLNYLKWRLLKNIKGPLGGGSF